MNDTKPTVSIFRYKAALVVCALAALAAAVGCFQEDKATAPMLPPHVLDLRPYDAYINPLICRATPWEPNVALPAHPSEWDAWGHWPWRYIVVHHSATVTGNAAEFDSLHRGKGWDELGYHFVIDNGQGGADGLIEVGSRWPMQKWGAHCGGTPDNEYNEYGIGICLVGDFTSAMPTAAQQASLRELLAYLMTAYNIPAARVIGHREAPNAKTDCPGNMFFAYLRDTLRPQLYQRDLGQMSGRRFN